MSRGSGWKRVASAWVAMAAAGLTGFGSAAASSPPTEDVLLPEGTYSSGEVSRDELVATGIAAGFSAEEAEAFLGDVPFNESVELSHWLDNGMWTSVVRFDTGVEDTPARGPYEVVDEATVIAPGICGGRVTLGYVIEDDAVTFDVIDDDCDDLGDRFFNALNYEAAPFVRVADEGDDAPVTLAFGNAASHGFPGGTAAYFEEVERLSGGTISVVSDGDNRDGDPHAEQSLLDDVRTGVVDIAVIGPRFFSTVGLDRVAALAPPMLIDSYDLQREIFARGLPDRLLGGLEELGVVAVAVTPGPIQKLVGFDRTFRTLDDFDGTMIGGAGGDVVGALGATTAAHVGGAPFTGFDGNIMSVGGMNGRHVDLEAESVAATGNLNLFAVPWIVIVNPDTYASLDADQQAALRDAGPATVDGVLESNIADQAEALQMLCAVGVEFVTMSDDDLADVRAALDPIYADLAADPEVAAYIQEVEQLKAELGVGPDSVTCPETTVDTTEAASVPGDGSGEQSLDGLYRWSILEDGAEVIITAFLESGEWGSSSTGDPHDAVGPGDNDGTHGTYVVDGDLVTFHIAEYDLDLTAQYTVDDDGTLHWTLPPPRIDPGSDGVFFQAPWVRIGAAESVDATDGSGWTHILGDAARSGVADAGPTGEPVELWRFHAEDACDGAPIVVGQTAFVACRDSNLYALSVSDGSESWRFHAAAPFGGGLAAADGLVYAADEAGTLYAVDMVAGTEVWRLDAGVTTTPATEGGLLAVGTGDGALVGFDAATGVERWRYVVADAVELRNPAIANGLVYAGSEAAGLAAVDASTGELVWQSDSDGPTGSVRVIDGTAYVGCSNGNATPLSAFDADTGDLRWRREGGCVFPPAVVDGVAYSGGEPGDVNAFDTGDGSELWHVATGSEVSQAPVVAGDVVYVITNGVDAAFAYDAATGEELWRYDLSASHAAPAVAGGRLYTTDSGGDVVAIGGSDQFPDADPVSESTATTTEPEPALVESTASISGDDDVAPASTSPATESTSGGWTNWRGDAGRTGVADAGPTGAPVELWRVQADGSCLPPPAVAAGVVYAACNDGVLYALDATTGTERWRFEGSGLGDVTAVGPLVYVNDADVLRALDSATGQERWQAAVPAGTSAVVDDGLLVIGTGDGFLLGLDAATGAERWRFQVSMNGAAHSPALGDGIAYVGGDDPGFFAVDAATGILLWRGDTGDDRTATAVVAEGIAYIGGAPDSGAVGHLYAFDATTGTLVWKRDQPLFTPTVLDGVGYSGGESGTVDAFDTADGTERWQAQLGGVVRNVAIADGVLYALSDGNNAIYALDASTGEQLWEFVLDSGIDGGIAVHGGAAYVATAFGGIYAVGGTDQGAVPVASSPPTSASVAETIVASIAPTEATEAPGATESTGPVTAPGPAVEEIWQSTGGPDGLASPAAMALDPQGQLWVADTGNHRFAIFTPDGEFVESWGSPGDGNGEFNMQDSRGDPFGAVAFAPDGSFYVLDVGNYRVQKFAADRTFVTSWGGFGQTPGTYTYPYGIAIDADGTVYVLDDGRDVVEWYSPDGTVLGSFDVVAASDGLSLDAASNAYLANWELFQIDKFDPAGNLVATIGAPGAEDGQFKGFPTSIAVDADGRVFVSETPEGGRVQVFDADGQFLASWGAEGQFPWGVVLDGQGNVYVDDLLTNTVHKFRLLPPLATQATGDRQNSVTTSIGLGFRGNPPH